MFGVNRRTKLHPLPVFLLSALLLLVSYALLITASSSLWNLVSEGKRPEWGAFSLSLIGGVSGLVLFYNIPKRVREYEGEWGANRFKNEGDVVIVAHWYD